MIHYLFLKENHFIDIEYFLDLVNKMIFPGIKCDNFYDFRCAPAWESSDYIVYTWYWLIMGFLLPLVIIIYANFKTVQCLKKVKIINIRLSCSRDPKLIATEIVKTFGEQKNIFSVIFFSYSKAAFFRK